MSGEGKAGEIKFIANSLRRLNSLADKFERGLNQLHGYAAIDDVLRELLDELPEQLSRLERAILILSNAGHPGMKEITDELEQDILKSHIKSLQKQIRQQHANRDGLQEESARHGDSPPLYLTNQIIGVTNEIDRLENEIKYFKELVK